MDNVRQGAAKAVGLPTNPRPPQGPPQPMSMPPPRHASLGGQTAMSVPPGQIPGMPGENGLTPAQQIAMANRPRYSLADPGFTPPNSSPRMRPAGANTPPAGSPRMRPAAGGTVGVGAGRGTGPGNRVPSGPNDGFNLSAMPGEEKRTHSPPPTKYHTFADMGIQGHQASEKDCVIM